MRGKKQNKMVNNLWHDVHFGKKMPKEVNVVVEIPMGSSVKYEFDKNLGIFKMDRVLYSPVHYPGDYGFVPRTLWEDNDPLDILVLSNHSLQTGVVLKARPIGVLQVIDRNAKDDKVIAVPVGDPRFSNFKDLKDAPPHLIKELKHFFRIYKELQGHKVQVLKILGRKGAEETIKKAVKLYRKKLKE